MSEYLESQRMRTWWVWLILALAQAVLLWGFIQQVVMGIPWGKRPTSDTMLIVANCILVIILLMVALMKLETRINTTGVYYRFPPFQWKWKEISWSHVDEVHVIHYSLLDYGGWGARWGGPKNGWGLCVSGNRGIQFRLDNGVRIMLGTKKPSQVSEYIEGLEQELRSTETFLFAH
jgi:hypothetical protein